MNKPFFSIIIPTYNRAKLITRCLSSVINQGFDDFEILIVDDGSTDETQKVVNGFSENDSRIRYFSQDNQGAGEARNHGAKVAKGEYLVFLDSDDEALPGWLEHFADVLNSREAKVACCGIIFCDLNGTTKLVKLPYEKPQGAMRLRGCFLSGTFAIAREVFEQVGGYISYLPANQHSEFRFRLFPLCDQFNWDVAIISEPLIRAWQHAGDNIRQNDAAVWESACYILNEHADYLGKSPRSLASWCTAAGGAAARLGKYSEARSKFLQAIRSYPKDLKNYARYLIALAPGLRSAIW